MFICGGNYELVAGLSSLLASISKGMKSRPVGDSVCALLTEEGSLPSLDPRGKVLFKYLIWSQNWLPSVIHLR
jgi:hypothetical protein